MANWMMVLGAIVLVNRFYLSNIHDEVLGLRDVTNFCCSALLKFEEISAMATDRWIESGFGPEEKAHAAISLFARLQRERSSIAGARCGSPDVRRRSRRGL